MPKRKIKDSLLPPDVERDALEAIREALKHPRKLSAKEEREFLQRRAHGAIERHEYIVTERRGQRVYREHGKGGADLAVPPFYWELLKKRRDFESECAKAERRPPQRKSVLDERISAAAAEVPQGRGRIKAIARRVGCNPKTVTRRLREMGQ